MDADEGDTVEMEAPKKGKKKEIYGLLYFCRNIEY